MYHEIPNYGLRAYSLFYSKFGTQEHFTQAELDWIVSKNMAKKIFSVLLRAGWIKKQSRSTYSCVKPEIIMTNLLSFKVQDIIKEASKEYAFTQFSAVEIWSDYTYVQRSFACSPYYLKILEKDISYWKEFFNRHRVPNFINSGKTIGEFVILIPVSHIDFVEKDSVKIDPLADVMSYASENEFLSYAYDYMREKYESS